MLHTDSHAVMACHSPGLKIPYPVTLDSITEYLTSMGANHVQVSFKHTSVERKNLEVAVGERSMANISHHLYEKKWKSNGIMLLLRHYGANLHIS